MKTKPHTLPAPARSLFHRSYSSYMTYRSYLFLTLRPPRDISPKSQDDQVIIN